MARFLAVILVLVLSAFDALAADMVLTPDLLEALEANARGAATPRQEALLFKNNDKINRARLNDWISDDQYQKAQAAYAERSEAFARAAAEGIAGEGSFTKQVAKPGKPKIYSAGTDSDYIAKVDNAAQIEAMQKRYNQAIDGYLEDHGVLDAHGTNWHNKLDVDFMADPSRVSKSEFEAIAKLNNDAYKRRLAAEYERISRAHDGSKVAPEHVRAYGEEMQDFINKKRAALDAARSDPDYWKDGANRADIYRKMAQEQKYIERLESLNDAWRKQNGLAPVNRDRATAALVADTDADGHTVLRRRVPMDADGFEFLEPTAKGSIAQRGSVRTPANIRDTYAANAVSQNSLNRAVRDLAQSYAEAARSNIDIRNAAPADIAALTKGLPAAEKGAILEDIHRITKSNFLKEGWSADQAERGAKAFTAEVAQSMRDLSPPRHDASIRQGFAEAFEEGRLQALANGVQPGSFTEVTHALDNVIKDSIGLRGDLSTLSPEALEKMSLTRLQLNELGEVMLNKVGPLVDRVFMAKEAYEAGTKIKRYMDEYSIAMNPDISDAEADVHFQAMEELSRDLIKQGLAGAGFGVLLESFPTVGAVVGTYLASYSGARWVLESTRGGQIIDRAVGDVMDAGVNAAETAQDKLREWTGGETRRMREARETASLLDSYRRAIDEGRVRLRPGVTMDDLADAVRRVDLAAIDGGILERVPHFSARREQSGGAISTADSEPYCIYVLDISGGSVFIGHPSDAKDSACHFWGGGLCRGAGNSPPRIIRTVTCLHSRKEATASWCNEINGKPVKHIPIIHDSKVDVYGGEYWMGLAPYCRNVRLADARPAPAADAAKAKADAAAAKARAEQEEAQRLAALRQREQEAALRAEQERERAARRQREEEQAAAEQRRRDRRAAAEAGCRRKSAVVAQFNESNGDFKCGCTPGMIFGPGEVCVSQRETAISICAKQNAEMQSLEPGTGKIVCACRPGMMYNRAKTACVTQQALREEDAASCAREFANSVLQYENGQPRCNCPQGWSWNRAEKACVTVEARRREAAQACANQFPGSIVSKLDIARNKEDCACPGGMEWGGAGGNSCVAQNVKPAPAPQQPTVSQQGAPGEDPTNVCIQCCYKKRDCLDQGPKQVACYDACKASCGAPGYKTKWISRDTWNRCPGP